MISLSVSQLKINPRRAISAALDYPVAIESRNRIQGYLVGKDLFEKIVAYIEDFIDQRAIKHTDFSKGNDFETVARKLGI